LTSPALALSMKVSHTLVGTLAAGRSRRFTTCSSQQQQSAGGSSRNRNSSQKGGSRSAAPVVPQQSVSRPPARCVTSCPAAIRGTKQAPQLQLQQPLHARCASSACSVNAFGNMAAAGRHVPLPAARTAGLPRPPPSSHGARPPDTPAPTSWGLLFQCSMCSTTRPLAGSMTWVVLPVGS
jgi:hypothetical protein